MKRKHFLTVLLASFFIIISLHGVDAQTSISGDDICGKTSECKISDLKIVYAGVFKLIITLGLPLMVVFIIYRFVVAWYALQQGNANAYREATKKVTQGLVGFVIIVALFGGIFLAMLRYLGVKEPFLQLLNSISATSIQIIPHAYAAGSTCAPPTKGNTCYFTAKGTSLVGTITDANSWFDKSLFCQDSTTGLTSNTDFVNNSNYWRGTTDCTGKTNGTVCDRGATYSYTMGICSNSYTPPDPHFTTGPADCVGKLPDTFCTPAGFVFGAKGGTCVSRTATVGEATCYPVGTSIRCLSPYNEGKVGTTDFNASRCIVVGDPCTENGKPGIFVQKPQNIFCVETVTAPATATIPPVTSTTQPVAAQAATQLTNPLGFTSLYDFILGALSLVMKFFIYPALVGIWVWSGFSFVLAQGAPDKLNKAKNLLLWAFVSTLIVFMTNMFLLALKGSVEKIVPASTTTTTVSPAGTLDGRVAPADGTYGAACTMPDGSTGTLGTDLICQGGRGTTTLLACSTFTTQAVCTANYSSKTRLYCKWSTSCTD